MSDRAYQLLRKATIRWRGTSLQPYFWLLAGAISVSLLQWPNWIPPALLGVILLAGLAHAGFVAMVNPA